MTVEPPSWNFTSGNLATLDMFKLTRKEQLIACSPWDLSPDRQPDGRFSEEKAREMLETAMREGSHFFDWTHKRIDGHEFPATVLMTRLERAGKPLIQATVRDITEQKEEEKAKARLQAQLLQAQKMESVGRLAGGIAHDFNNMLGVILGHTEMALQQLDPSHSLCDDLEEIKKAAERSANLAHQLLAFARKQTAVPKVIDLNQTVTSMLVMLERLIGEDVQLVWKPVADLWSVNIDPSQFDQVLTNLCVNARDAIIDVGTITIETGNCAIDDAFCANHSGAVPGEYVVLAVQDGGCGMNKEILSHLFEPFFTTKEVGKGTGLGLATVYGIVKQNKGFISVESQVGLGTTFSIYLPRHIGKAEQTRKQKAVAFASHGQETILVVEDEAANLKLIRMMLEKQGYRVLEAGTPGEAIRIAQEHDGQIDLLMTDVIMPDMNGRDLAMNLLSLHPHIKRLFMSGYPADVIADHGVLEEGVYFIQKPFSAKDLGEKVRQTLAQNGP
jgi:PAS domain S-box-containing protein